MADTVDKETRSRIMARIRSKGNASTELRMRMILVNAGISGWKMHANSLAGCPDFIFPDLKVVVFVDGCFWHGCSKCGHIPKSNKKYWEKKLQGNINRDKRNHRTLRRQGWSVLRFWEHNLDHTEKILSRLNSSLEKKQRQSTRLSM